MTGATFQVEESPLRRSSFVVVIPAFALLFTVALHACGNSFGAGELLGADRLETRAEASPGREAALRAPGSPTAPSGLPVGASGQPSEPLPSLDVSAETSLEALLPNEVRGVPLLKVSVAGEAFDTDATRALLLRLQASPEDASAAFAVDPTGQLDGQIVALRVVGADSERLRDEYREAVETVAGNPLREVTIADRPVLTGVNPEDPQSAVYFYARGDVLFFVFTPDASLAAEALTLLP